MKIGVVTDPESAAGYRLGGLEVAVAENEAEALEILTRMVRTDEYALIIVNMTLVAHPYHAVLREMRHRELPVLLAAPSHRRAVAAGEDAEEYMRRLIKDAIGYEIKL